MPYSFHRHESRYHIFSPKSAAPINYSYQYFLILFPTYQYLQQVETLFVVYFRFLISLEYQHNGTSASPQQSVLSHGYLTTSRNDLVTRIQCSSNTTLEHYRCAQDSHQPTGFSSSPRANPHDASSKFSSNVSKNRTSDFTVLISRVWRNFSSVSHISPFWFHVQDSDTISQSPIMLSISRNYLFSTFWYFIL